MSDVTSRHDLYFRETFSRRATVQELVRRYVPSEVVRYLDLRTLKITDASFVAPALRMHVSDLVCRVEMSEGGEAYLYLLFEHKSRPDRLVGLQLLRYASGLWDRALDDGQKLPLPPVIPLVFYHGRRRWTFPTEFDALLGGPEALAPFMPRFRYALIDLSQYSDEEIRGGVLLRVALLAMRHIYDRDLPQHMPRIARLLLAVIGTRSGLRALEALMHYFVTASDLVGAKEVREALKGLPIEGEKLMGTLAEKWIQEGIQKGIQKGAALTAREGLLNVLEARFGRVPLSVVERIREAEDVGMLQGLLKEAATAESLEQFQKALEGARTG